MWPPLGWVSRCRAGPPAPGAQLPCSPAFRHAQLSFSSLRPRRRGNYHDAPEPRPGSAAPLAWPASIAGRRRLAVNGAGRTLKACRGTGLARPGYGSPGSQLRVLDLLDDSAAELPLNEFHAAQAVRRPRSGGVVWPLLVGDGSWLGRRRVTGPRRLGLACPGRPGPGSPGCGGCGARWLRCPSSFGGPASGGAVRCSWA